jgi:hypothetical protein
MSDVSTASSYTSNPSHLRSVIPVTIVQQVHVKPGAALKWSAIDDITMMVKVVA